MRRLRLLTNRHRSGFTNRTLGYLLAFNAGALNAGGFLVLHMYTSHMTGFASQIADGLVLSNVLLLLNALGAILAFMVGAGLCAIMVVWARQQRIHSVYALPLMLEALLLLPFGFAGAATLNWRTPFAVPATVLLLSFIMGLQNAVGSKTSGGSIRTTHMTGNVTDLGMELGKALLRWRRGAVPAPSGRMRLAGGLLAMFIAGGMAGAVGFKQLGFVCVVPLAVLLLVLSLPPLVQDVRAIGVASLRMRTTRRAD